MGFDWPFSIYYLIFGTLAVLLVLVFHCRNLLKSTLPEIAWKLIVLRVFSTILLLLLVARPFVEKDELDESKFRLLAMADLSGSMDVRDDRLGLKRIEQVRPHLEVNADGNWIDQQKLKYGQVELFGFAEDSRRLLLNSWEWPAAGKKTALGEALSNSLLKSDETPESPVGSVVLFSDGKNNFGRSVLELGKEYRARGIPVNVIGVGKIRPKGDLEVKFIDRKPLAVAKEEILLVAGVRNQFDQVISTQVQLMRGKDLIEKIPVNLKSGETRTINFSPLVVPKAGSVRYRVEAIAPEGDIDPANDLDTLLVEVKPPVTFSILYLSNKPRPLYPFLKRTLSKEERFEFNSLIRLGDEVFHALGEDLDPAYPQDPEFWMTYDAIIADADALSELNSSVIESLKGFVQKRGGGLAIFGSLQEARDLLGGAVPAKTAERIVFKQDMSLAAKEEPLFGPEDDVEKMKPFLPGRLPGYLVTERNPASRGVVVVRASGEAVLAIQAYGAGKVAYWGSPNDWRRSLRDEDGSREFDRFWHALVQWLGSGGEDRMKITETGNEVARGTEALLRVEALGSDFEPAMDALIEAVVSGPGDFSQKVQLYPKGSVAGQYEGNFRPGEAGAYEVSYLLQLPDGEKLQKKSVVRVSESSTEAQDTTFAERDLKMLTKLTGGEYLHISELTSDWEPAFAQNLPTLMKRKSLADVWPVFILLFLASGIEWIFRRQVGLR